MNARYLTEVVEQRQVKTKVLPATKEPKKYRVVLINDDYTPMDFVVRVLEKFFYFSQHDAVHIMLQVHYHGKGICGVFTREIAETKAVLVNEFSRHNDYPLLCRMEPE